MFAVKLKFASNYLLKWFNRKFKTQNLKIDLECIVTYEAFNPLDFKKTKCVICEFLLQINAKGPNIPANQMSFILDTNISF